MNSRIAYVFGKLFAAGEVCPENRPWGLKQEEIVPFDRTNDDSKPSYNFSLRDQMLSSAFITIYFHL